MRAKYLQGRCGGVFAALAVFLVLHASSASAVDYFTERMTDSSRFAYKSIRFSPVGGEDFYETCVTDIERFPVPPIGGTELDIADNGFVLVNPGVTVEFYGERYDSIGVCANGYVGLPFGDVNFSPTLTNHFNIPKVSGFYQDLDPTQGGTISWKIYEGQVVVTYRNIPRALLPEATVSFQIQFTASGGLILSYEDVPDAPTLIGLSKGNGTPDGFLDSDLLDTATCQSDCLTAATDSAGALARIYQDEFGVEPDGLDLDVNGISDFANLKLLDQVLRLDSAVGHCAALSVWENNIGIVSGKLANLPDSEIPSVDRDDLLFAMTGMVTLGSNRFPGLLLSLLGTRADIGLGRGEDFDTSAFDIVNWPGDVDGDGACNYGEYIAVDGNTESFLTAAFDADINDDADSCFGAVDPAEGEAEDDEGEFFPEGEAEGVLICVVPMDGRKPVPPTFSAATGEFSIIDQGTDLLVTITHNVPTPATANLYQGRPGERGDLILSLGNSSTGGQISALLSRNFLELLSAGYYVEVNHTGNIGGLDIRGNILCPFFELDPVEGEDPPEGEAEVTEAENPEAENPEGEAETGPEAESPEAEVIEEGELEAEAEPAEPILLCRYTLRGNKTVPPTVTPYTGVLTITQIGRRAELVLTHDVEDEISASINLGQPGSNGPALLTLPFARSPIVTNLSADVAEFLTSGTYYEVTFGGDNPGGIRADMDCEFQKETAEGEAEIVVDGEAGIDGEAAFGGEAGFDGEAAPEGAGEGAPFRFHSADYLDGGDGILSLTEVLRIVQYFNIGGYGCGDTEDGYVAGGLLQSGCDQANFEFPPGNWIVDLSELLRIIQLYNAGGYVNSSNTLDGFAPLP